MIQAMGVLALRLYKILSLDTLISIQRILLFFLLITLITYQVSAKSYLTISIDDGLVNTSLYTYPILQSRGLVATINIITNDVGTTGYMNLTQINELYNNGWEIGSHSKTHINLVGKNSSILENEINGSKTWLVSNGFPVQSFVYPFSAQDINSSNVVNKYYTVARTLTTTNGRAYNVSEIDSIIGFNYESQGFFFNSDSQIIMWLNTSINNNRWLTLYFHDVNASGFVNYSTDGGQNLSYLSDYIKSRVNDSSLEVCTYIECYYKMKNISSIASSKTYTISNNSNFTFSLKQDVISPYNITIQGITINNTVPNPSFEIVNNGVPTNWTVSAGHNISINNTDAKYGSNSLNLTVNISASFKSAASNFLSISSLGLSIGDTYYVSGWFKNVKNVSQAQLSVGYYTNSTSFITQTAKTVSLNGWTQISFSGTIPATTGKIQIGLVTSTVSGTTNSNASMLIDGIILSKKNNNYQYIDGAQNSTNISLYDGINYFNVSDIGTGQSSEFRLIKPSGNVSVYSNGSLAINVSIGGDRLLSVKYGFVNNTIITESFSNKTEVEFWNNTNINLIQYINYSIRTGISGTIGTMMITPTALLNITISSWNITGDYLKVFNETSPNSTNEVQYHVGDNAPSSNHTVRIYWNNGTKFQDFYIFSNSTGYINYNSTGFDFPRYTIIVKEEPGIPYTLIVITATVIIGGVVIILRRFKKVN